MQGDIMWKNPHKKLFILLENMEALQHTYTRVHTQTHTHAGICPGQDAVNASFSWHLLKGKSGLEAVVWHQHSRSDTIYHRPPNMDTFITSWQENLVESNHLGFDNDSDASFAPRLDGVLFSFTVFLICGVHQFSVFMNLPSTVVINKMLQTNPRLPLIYLFF